MVNASKQRQRQRKKAQASAAGQAFAKAAQASQETSAPDSDDDQPDISTQTAVLNGKHTSNNGHITSHTTEHASAEEHGPSRSPDSTGKDESLVSAPPAMPQGLDSPGPDQEAQSMAVPPVASSKSPMEKAQSEASPTSQEEGPPGTSSDVGQDVGPRSRSTAGFDPLGKMTNGRGSAHSSPGKKARAAAPEPGSESAAALAAALAWLSAPGNGNEADKAPAATSFGNLQEPSANQLGGQSDRQEGGRETPPTGPTADYVSEAAESQENLPATASDKASVSSEGIKAGAESYAGGAPRIAESLQQPEEPAKQANHSPKNQRGASLRQLEQMIRAQFSGSTPSSSGQGSVALSEPGTAAVDAQNPEPSQHAQQLKALEQQARGQFSGAAMPATSHSQNPKPSQLEALEKQVGGQFPAAGAPSKSKETTDGKSSHWREAEARARQGLPSADMAAVEAHRGPSKKAGKPALHKARRSGKHVHFNGESAPAPDDCQEESEVKKLTGQLEQIRNELHSAHEELHKARSQLQGVEKERDDMAGKLAAWEKRSSTLSGSQAKLESRVNDLQRQLARQRQDINAAAGGRPANNRLVWTFGTTTLASMAFAAYLFVRCVNGHPRSRL
ncbi:hypothetical protein WJX84_006017 [Apatococcus fuscideae]|uniref:Transmembrane protein n=1 Tax=Apatococcus fuscideae TaxID=2026836 RepID=A0AAW1SW95_9CHLO